MKTIKSELKTLALELRELKNKINNGMRAGEHMWREQNKLPEQKHEFRHKHIAYCLLRGRTIEQIECNYSNSRDDGYVEILLEQFKARLAPVAEEAVGVK